jgi:hypothetical protein
MKNSLKDLNDHLFMAIERLGDEELDAERIDAEVKRAGAIVGVADQIVRNADLQLKAVKLVADHGDRFMTHLPMIAKAEDRAPPPARTPADKKTPNNA